MWSKLVDLGVLIELRDCISGLTSADFTIYDNKGHLLLPPLSYDPIVAAFACAGKGREEQESFMQNTVSKAVLKVLEERYLLKDEEGKIIETPTQMFRRVAIAIDAQDANYGKDPLKTQDAFYQAMRKLEFLPNSPTLMNAGTKLGQLSACFVLPIEDSLEGIFTTLKHMALIQQSGGGTGFSFSHLREKGAIVKSTKVSPAVPSPLCVALTALLM